MARGSRPRVPDWPDEWVTPGRPGRSRRSDLRPRSRRITGQSTRCDIRCQSSRHRPALTAALGLGRCRHRGPRRRAARWRRHRFDNSQTARERHRSHRRRTRCCESERQRHRSDNRASLGAERCQAPPAASERTACAHRCTDRSRLTQLEHDDRRCRHVGTARQGRDIEDGFRRPRWPRSSRASGAFDDRRRHDLWSCRR